MAEEVKNSSPKPDKNLRPIRENALKLHYFPEIPMNGSDNLRSGKGGTTPFQRVRYKADGSGQKQTGSTDVPENLPLTDRNIKEIETQAYIRGFNKGEKDGYASANSRIEKKIKEFAGALNDVSKLREQIMADIEAEIVELALAIAGKIVCCEIKTNPGLIVGVLSEALQKVESHQNLNVRLNPKDLEFIRSSGLQLTDYIDSTEQIKIVEDPGVSRGGCLVQTDSGEIDARIEKQIDVIAESFRAQLEQPTSNPDDHTASEYKPETLDE